MVRKGIFVLFLLSPILAFHTVLKPYQDPFLGFQYQHPTMMISYHQSSVPSPYQKPSVEPLYKIPYVWIMNQNTSVLASNHNTSLMVQYPKTSEPEAYYPPYIRAPLQYPQGIDPLDCANYPFCSQDSTVFRRKKKGPKGPNKQKKNKKQKKATTCPYPHVCLPDDKGDFEVSGSKAINDPTSCQAACKDASDCQHFTFTHFLGISMCRLFKTCTKKIPRWNSHEAVVSGPKICGCKPLTKLSTGQTAWVCKTASGTKVTSPYEKTALDVGTECTASCGSVLKVTSTCDSVGSWSTSVQNWSDSARKSLTRSPRTTPDPDQGSVTCPCQIPAAKNPNTQKHGELLCNGKNYGSGDVTVFPGDTCSIKCVGLLVMTLGCEGDGEFSSQRTNATSTILNPGTDLRCFQAPPQVSCWGRTGWSSFGGRCYKLLTGEQEMSSYKDICEGFGGHLASIHNMEENNFIVTLLRSGSSIAYLTYIGGKDCSSNSGGKCTWLDGTPWDWSNWQSGQPNDDGGCVRIGYSSGAMEEWFDGPCSHYNEEVDAVCKT